MTPSELIIHACDRIVRNHAVSNPELAWRELPAAPPAVLARIMAHVAADLDAALATLPACEREAWPLGVQVVQELARRLRL